METLKQVIERVFLSKIKIVGDNEHTYYGTPQEIMDELENELKEDKIKIANYFQFLAAVVYHLNNSKSKMDIPSILYEAIENKVKQFPKDRVMTEDEALKLAGRN